MVTNELKRTIKFAESLGLKIRFVKGANKDYHGCYVHPDKKQTGEIEICRGPRTTITFQIITLLHEIGHHLDYTERLKMPAALCSVGENSTPKWARKAIFNAEKRAVGFGEQLYWTLMLKIPFWKVKKELDTDIYIYRYFYIYGDYPTGKSIAEYQKRWDKKKKKSLMIVNNNS